MDTAVVTLSVTALVLGMTARWQLTRGWARLTGPLRSPHPPPIRLLPGERPVAVIAPDRELCLLCMALTLAVLAATIRLVTLKADPAGIPPLVLLAALVAVPVLAETLRTMRGGWLVTDRRLITASGASVPLSALRRIAVGPTALIVEAGVERRFALSGLANPRAAARLIHATALAREGE